MNTISVTLPQALTVVGVLVVLVMIWRAGARRGKASANAERSGVRLLSLAGRVVVNAVVIVTVQWVIITHRGDGWLLLGALGVPALFASYALTKALMVTAYVPRRGGGRR
ncbi:hypothetical protein [Lentzea sp. NPDC003310]|uniref:hypothetical protein n=1 Tax=Lentzea sp. NPDC003310 TaxID=3154447 RepID=UPI0033B79F31